MALRKRMSFADSELTSQPNSSVSSVAFAKEHLVDARPFASWMNGTGRSRPETPTTFGSHLASAMSNVSR